jgi:hypothetical protein
MGTYGITGLNNQFFVIKDEKIQYWNDIVPANFKEIEEYLDDRPL